MWSILYLYLSIEYFHFLSVNILHVVVCRLFFFRFWFAQCITSTSLCAHYLQIHEPVAQTLLWQNSKELQEKQKMRVVETEYLKHVGDKIRRNRVKTGWVDGWKLNECRLHIKWVTSIKESYWNDLIMHREWIRIKLKKYINYTKNIKKKVNGSEIEDRELIVECT